MKKILALLLAVMLTVCFVGCGKDKDKSKKDEVIKIGDGENNFYLIVIKDADKGEQDVYEVFSDEVMLGDALSENGLLNVAVNDAGETYISTVGDVTIDYDKDKKYWTFTENGAICPDDVFSTGIQCNSRYAFMLYPVPKSDKKA